MKQNIENQLKGFDLREIRCPFCNGVVNSKWFDEVIADYAHFVAECWSGNIDDSDKPRHIFRFAIRLPDTIYIDRKDNDEGLPSNEWVLRK